MFDPAQCYYQARLREAYWWKTSFRSQLGQFRCKLTGVPFGPKLLVLAILQVGML